MNWVSTFLIASAFVSCLPGTAAAQAGDDPLPPNPFGVFESFRLANGLRVFYGHLPGATITSMAVVVPYGSDHDPPGKEQTAHFLEHVLLSDRDARTEAELVRELIGRGGTFAGITGPDYTAYPISIPSELADFGVHWLHGIVAPRLLPDSLIEANREPVAAELRAGRRSPLPDPTVVLLGNRRSGPPGFWEREFGYAASEERGHDALASLRRVTPDDVRAFFDTHYGPTVMTVVIVTGRPLSEMQPSLVETFGTLPWRPTPAQQTLQPRTQETRRFGWRPGAGTRLSLRYRIAEPSAQDHLRLIFLEDLLRERLTRRLRSGSVKYVYSVQVRTEVRGLAAYFGLALDMDARHEATVRAAIEEELVRIGTPASDTAAFYADRDALSRSLRVEYAAPGPLRQLAMQRFFRPGMHQAFPDLGEYYATVGPDSIAAFSTRLFAPENRIITLSRPLPWSPFWLLAIGLLIITAAARVYRLAALRPADMTAIRYVARLRRPLAARLTAVALGTIATLVVLRIGAAGTLAVADRFIVTVDSLPLHAAAAGALLFGTTLLALACIGLVHRKVLVFDHEIRLKSATYRSTLIPVDDVRGLRVLTSQPGIRLRRPVLGSTAGGVLIELRDGSGYVLHVRDAAALQRSVQGVLDRHPVRPGRAAGVPASRQPVAGHQPTAGPHAPSR